MKFILTSNSYQVTRSWSQQFGLIPQKLKAAFIDTAADMYDKPNAAWLQVDREALVEVGFTVSNYTLTGKTKAQLQTELAEFDVLFVAGGNTFYLLEQSNKSGFTELIRDDYFSDKIYIGSSAGSVLLSDDIDPIKHLDNPKKATLESTNAIGILDFVVFPHWGSENFRSKYKTAIQYAYDQAAAVLTLANNQYALVSSEGLKLITVTEKA